MSLKKRTMYQTRPARAIIIILSLAPFKTFCTTYVDTVIPKIKIVVNGADQPNANTGLPARTLWAATTRYETKGYEFEKVKLSPGNRGEYKGDLPVKAGTKSVSVIIWDDRIQNPFVYGGSPYAPYSKNHKLYETKGYFTPCRGFQNAATGKPLYQSLSGNKLPAFSALLPAPYVNGGGISNETYFSATSVRPGSKIKINFAVFNLPTLNHCRCSRPLTYMTSTYYTSTPVIFNVSDWRLLGSGALHFTYTANLSNVTRFRERNYLPAPTPAIFTDTNGSLTGGACNMRFP